MAFIKRGDAKIIKIIDPNEDINQEEASKKLKKLMADKNKNSKNEEKSKN